MTHPSDAKHGAAVAAAIMEISAMVPPERRGEVRALLITLCESCVEHGGEMYRQESERALEAYFAGQIAKRN